MDFSFSHVELASPRLTLRTLVSADATEAYVDWLNDPEVNKYLQTKHATLEGVREYIEKMYTQDSALFLGIFLRATARHIGSIKLDPIDTVARTATMSIMIGDRSAWGKEYAPEAIATLARYCFEELKFEAIDLGVEPANYAAIRAYGKVGFVETKRYKALRKGGELQDNVRMVVTPETFRSASVVPQKAV